ncbi:DUF962 domain-containing protein [Rhodoferax sp.]|uniref:Mpo1 family 2-hydroxy fatty acid dioxygenase n=1 Tax=Rhodoferax sp. TaxID=50421 RepID=UPI00374CC2B9
MRTLVEQLSNYAAYHRHPRNVLTHCVGIPMIVAAVAVLLSRPSVHLLGWALTPALVVVVAALVYYLVLDLGLGLLMALLMGLALWFGAWSAAQPTHIWLAIGQGGFIAGWTLQFVGHYIEGRKPAFVDDVMGLAIGPLFVLVEVLFWLGFRHKLRSEMAARAAGGAPLFGAKNAR